MDGLIVSGVLNLECVQALAKVAETRRLEKQAESAVKYKTIIEVLFF